MKWLFTVCAIGLLAAGMACAIEKIVFVIYHIIDYRHKIIDTSGSAMH